METSPPHLCRTLREGAQRVDDSPSDLPTRRARADAQPSCQTSAEPCRPINACLKHEAGLLGLTVWTKQGSCTDMQTHLSAGGACASNLLGRAKPTTSQMKDSIWASAWWSLVLQLFLKEAEVGPALLLGMDSPTAHSPGHTFTACVQISLQMLAVERGWLLGKENCLLSAPSSANPKATQSVQQEAGERWWW